MARSIKFLFCLSLLFSVGCAKTLIVNTDVEDTHENREVVQFCERYRHAVEERDVTAVLSLASPTYFDDNGTPTGEDDVDLDGLREKLTHWAEGVLAVRYEMRYHRVLFRDDKVYVDYTYTGSFRVRTGTGDRWSRRLADNRIVLRRENDEYRVLSGM